MQLSVSLIILVAFFAESVFGFGGALLSIPLLSLILPVKDAIGLVLLFQFLIGVLIIKTYKFTNWRALSYMALGLFLGSVLGTLSLKVASEEALRVFLAIMILVFLIRMIFLPKYTFGQHNRLYGFMAGLSGSYIQGLIGSGGPIFTMYLLNALPKKQEFRATLIFLFFATSIVRLCVAVQQNLISPAVYSLAAPIVLPFIAIVFLGHHFHWKIPDTYYRYAVYIILFGASLSLFFRR